MPVEEKHLKDKAPRTPGGATINKKFGRVIPNPAGGEFTKVNALSYIFGLGRIRVQGWPIPVTMFAEKNSPGSAVLELKKARVWWFFSKRLIPYGSGEIDCAKTP